MSWHTLLISIRHGRIETQMIWLNLSSANRHTALGTGGVTWIALDSFGHVENEAFRSDADAR